MQPAAFIDDPNWADFLPEMREPPRRRHLPTHEDCSRIDPEAAAAHLKAGGTLGRMPNYEERPGQLEMLASVVRAYNAREHLMVEAGTGIGKSLAYLIPSILWAWTNDTPVIVSTATRNLQSQLIASDIPKAVQALGADAAHFKVALLKGRANYLCLRAVSEFFAAGYWTMSAEEQAEMPHFIDWLKTTPDGDLDGYDGLPRQLLSCPGEECSGRRCPFYSRCFVYWARKRAAEAHLVVANHALVLAESANGGGTILPPYGRLMLDEAHNLETIATDYLSYEFSLSALTRLLDRLMRRGRGRRGASVGILASVQRQLQKGILSGSGIGERVRRLLADATGLSVRILAAAEDVLDLAARLLKPIRGGDFVRYRVSAGRRYFSVRGLFQEYPADIWSEDDLFAAQTRLENELAAMVNLLHDLRDALAAPDEAGSCADLAVQLDGMAMCFVAFANEANFVLKGERDTHAYWIEKVRQEKRRTQLRLVAAPLSVADDLNRILYEVKDAVVLSSATLRVGNDFTYMARRLGFFARSGDADRFRSFTVTSPFNYLMQSLVLAPDCLPDPSVNPAGYAESLAALLKDLFAATHGRALVLFTSHEMMKSVAESAHASLVEAGIRLLVQGEGLSREAMTHALRESHASTVLFGAQSFWEGVDVAGAALSCVVIARLPFQMVGDPVVEARSEKIDRDGGSSFRDYALPEAVIRFRQGFGRLIRSKRDRGVVIVTDPRLVTKNYGSSFRRSIPTSVHTVTELSDLLARVSDFFA
ncbi:MAG: ATP-dependent DNA helicase [Kiritimatiellia bacterium]